MEKILITKSVNADTRTAEKFDKDSLRLDTMRHIIDVGSIMSELGMELHRKGLDHDRTKLKYLDEFYSQFKILRGEEFIAASWYQKHIAEERHHIMACKPADVNLLDVVEEIADKVAAGKGRNGEVSLEYFTLDKDTVWEAYLNTIKLIDNMTQKE